MRRTLLLLFTLLAFAQAATEVEITAEPHHHLTLANDHVRVFYVEVAPHSETLMHWHRHDYVFVTLGPADVVNAVKDKPPITLKLADGETRFSPASFAHVARNLSDQPFRNVTIEFLEDEKLRQLGGHPEEDRGLEILHAGTQQILWVQDGVRASEFELEPGGIAPPLKHPFLLVAVSNSDLRLDLQGRQGMAALTPTHLKSGDSKWFAAKPSPSMVNVGHDPAKFVTLEFP